MGRRNTEDIESKLESHALTSIASESERLNLDYASYMGQRGNDKTIYQHIEEKINDQTGEITQRTSFTAVRKSKTDDHVQFYLGNISGLLDMDLSKREYDVMCALMTYVLPRNNLLMLNAGTRRMISTKLNFSEKSNSVNKAIASLVEKRIIYKHSGQYFLSPFHFGKGQWENISKMRIQVEKTLDFESGNVTVVRSSSATYKEDGEEGVLSSNESLQVINAEQHGYVANDGVPTHEFNITVEDVKTPIECVDLGEHHHIEDPYDYLSHHIPEPPTDFSVKKSVSFQQETSEKNDDEVKKLQLKLDFIREENRQLELKIKLAELQK